MLFELAAILGGLFIWRRHEKKKRRREAARYAAGQNPYNSNYGYNSRGYYPEPPPYHETDGLKGYDHRGSYAGYGGGYDSRAPYGNEYGGYGGNDYGTRGNRPEKDGYMSGARF
jgi:hypothetical protein